MVDECESVGADIGCCGIAHHDRVKSEEGEMVGSLENHTTPWTAPSSSSASTVFTRGNRGIKDETSQAQIDGARTLEHEPDVTKVRLPKAIVSTNPKRA